METRKLLIQTATTAINYTVRRETYDGRECIVVPVVMMREGVHSGSHGAIYHTSEELGRHVAAWNGIPVVVNHPEVDGVPVSANEREVLEREKIGRIFNAGMDGDKLKAEAWIDIQKLTAVSPSTLEALEGGRAMDVSVGVFSDEEEIEGTWNSESYHSIAHNYRPDHLALLPEAQGACSWQDGCGVRVNKKEGGMDVIKSYQINDLVFQGTETGKWKSPSLRSFTTKDWSDLDEKEKERIQDYFLITANKGQDFEANRFPVVNPESGNLNVNALKEVTKLAFQSRQLEDHELLALNRAKQLLKQEFGESVDCCELAADLKRMSAKGFRADLIVNETGYVEIAEKLQRLLDTMDTENEIYFLEEVYAEEFVYRVRYQSNNETKFFKRPYAQNDAGQIELGQPVVSVKKEVVYEEINVNGNLNVNKNKKVMNEKVDALINNEATKYTEEDREWLEGLEANQLEKMSPVEVEKKDSEFNLAEEIKNHAKTPEEFIELMPEGLKDSMNSALKLHKEKRASMIAEIQDNTEKVWEKDELEAMSMETLAKIHKSIPRQVDYSAQGASDLEINQGADEDEKLLPPGVESEKE